MHWEEYAGRKHFKQKLIRLFSLWTYIIREGHRFSQLDQGIVINQCIVVVSRMHDNTTWKHSSSSFVWSPPLMGSQCRVKAASGLTVISSQVYIWMPYANQDTIKYTDMKTIIDDGPLVYNFETVTEVSGKFSFYWAKRGSHCT